MRATGKMCMEARQQKALVSILLLGPPASQCPISGANNKVRPGCSQSVTVSQKDGQSAGPMARREPTVLFIGKKSGLLFFQKKKILSFILWKAGKFVPFYKYSVGQNGDVIYFKRKKKSMLLTSYMLSHPEVCYSLVIPFSHCLLRNIYQNQLMVFLEMLNLPRFAFINLAQV